MLEECAVSSRYILSGRMLLGINAQGTRNLPQECAMDLLRTVYRKSTKECIWEVHQGVITLTRRSLDRCENIRLL